MSARTGFIAGVAFVAGVVVGLGVSRVGGVTSKAERAGSPAMPQFVAPPDREQARLDSEFRKKVASGNQFMDAGKYKEAVAKYRSALEIRFDADVATDLGVCYRQSGDPNMALLAFRDVIASSPGHWQARYNAAVILLELGQFREAKQLIAGLRRERPADDSALKLEKALAKAVPNQ